MILYYICLIFSYSKNPIIAFWSIIDHLHLLIYLHLLKMIIKSKMAAKFVNKLYNFVENAHIDLISVTQPGLFGVVRTPFAP